MATKHTNPCLLKAADDEPLFVLRAQDRLAPHVVREWARQFRQVNSNMRGEWTSDSARVKHDEALDLAVAMESYKHRKMPD